MLLFFYKEQIMEIIRKNPIKSIIIGAAALIVIITVLCSGLFTKGSEMKSFSVNKGDGTIIISNRLKDEGLINSAFLFRCYSTLTGKNGKWQPGTVSIKGGYSFPRIAKALTELHRNEVRVLIPEGKQVRHIGDILEKKGVCKKKDFINACVNNKFDYPFLKGINTKKRISGLEGYLFCDTYYFEKNADVNDVINAMLSRFQEKVYTDEIRNKVKKTRYSFDEIIILSSIVESEATTKKDRRTVAGVFLNRLEKRKHGKLQSCVTVEYAKGIKKHVISFEDTKYKSPYNTYMYEGLPYGPISCPSLESINAVLDPIENNYYYFQSDSHSRLYFAETFEEHIKLQEKIHKNWDK